MFKVLFAFIFLGPFYCLAQPAISGRVLNAKDRKPVSNVTVFLNDATIGGKTGQDGTFTLYNAKAGKYELVVSSVGYETYRQNIALTNAGLKLPDIFITSKTIILSQVSIHAGKGHRAKIITHDNPEWPSYFEQFKIAFLGVTELARDCEILNPEVINIKYNDSTNVLTASSDDFIEITNKALGYKIKYLLTSFTKNSKDVHAIQVYYTGSDFFEELKGSAPQVQRWKKRREEVYEGSAMHFLRSALQNRINEEGFRVLRLDTYRNPKRPDDTLINTKIKYYAALKSKTSSQRDLLSFWNKKSKLPRMLQSLINFPLNTGDIIKTTNQKGNYALGCDYDDLYISYSKNHHFEVIRTNENLDSPANDQTTLVHFNSP